MTKTMRASSGSSLRQVVHPHFLYRHKKAAALDILAQNKKIIIITPIKKINIL